MSENKTEVKARIMPAEDGSIKVVFFSAPASPPLLGAKAASCAKNAPVEDVTVAESGAEEAPLDESILKQDLAAEEAETVDSDRAKAMFAAHKPSADAVFWSKFERPTDPPPARTGVTKNGPALEPVTEDSPALEVTAGGAPLPSIKEFPEEEPAAAGDADWNVSTKEFPVEEPAPAGIDEWKTPSPLRKIERKGESNLVDRSKKTTKNLTPIGRVDPNGFAALLGTDVDEEDLAGVGSAKASVDKEDLAGVGSGKASVNDAPPSSTTPSGGAGEKTEPTSTRSGFGSRSGFGFGMFGSPKGKFCSSKLLCVIVTVVIGLGCSAFPLSSHGSGGVSEHLESVFLPNATAIPFVDFSNITPEDVTPMAEPNSGLLFASPDRHPTFAPVSLGASARPTVAASRPTRPELGAAPSGVAKVATFIKKGSCSDASSAIEERTLPDPDSTLYGQTIEERLNECLANKFVACTRFVSPAEKGVISCPSGRTICLQEGHEWVDANACFAPCPKGLVWHGPESLEGACVKDCPEGTGRDELNIKCLPCATSCGGSCWLGDAEWACGDKCKDSLPLVKGGLLKRTEHTCVASCPSGTYQVNEECVADHRDVDGAYNNQCTGPNYWTKHPPDICNDGLSCNTLVDAGSVRKEKCCFSQSDKGKGENCAYDFGEIPEGYRASTNHACVLPKPLENGRCFQDPTTWIVDAGNAAKVPWIGFTTDEGWPAGADNVFKQLSLFVAQTDDIREKYNNLRSARSWQSTLKGEPSKNYAVADACNETCVDNVKAQLNAELDILTTANDWAETIDNVAESHKDAALSQTESVDELLKVENYQVTLAGTDSQTSYVTEMVSSAASFGLSKVPGGDVISLMTSTVGLFLGQETDPDPEIVAFPSTNSKLTMAYDEYKDMVGSNVVGTMALTQLENVASRDWGSLATFGMLAKGMTQPLWSDTVSAGWDDEATCTTYTGVYKYWCAKDVYWQNALKALMPAKYKLCTTRVECYYRCERSCDCTTSQRARQEWCYDYNGEQSPKHDPHHIMFEQWHAMFYDTRDGIEMNYRYTATFGYLCSGDSTDNRLDDTWIEHAWKHGYLEEFHHPEDARGAGGAVADFLRATYSSNVDGSYFNCGDCKYDDQDSYTNAVMSAEPMAVNGLQLRKLPWQDDKSDNNGMLQVGNSMDWNRKDDKFTYDNPWLEEAPCCCGHSNKCYGTVPCGDQTHGFLMIRVVSGRDVRGKGNNCEGKRDRDCLETDPYVKVSTKDYGLLNCGYGFKCDQTDYKDDTDKPVWNKDMNFGVQPIGTTITVELWDYDPGNNDDDFMGRTTFSVPGKTGVFELFVEGDEGKGHIKLNVTFDLPGNN